MELAKDKKAITDRFFLTGGTALSEFYLHHRLSEDLDFFSTLDVSTQDIDPIIVGYINQYKGATFTRTQYFGLYRYQIQFSDGDTLKMDFNHFYFDQINHGTKYGNLEIASLWDITVDKTYLILGSNPRSRDYIDLYYAIQEQGCDLDQLRRAMNEKYEFETDDLSVIQQFSRVKDIVDLPRMLVPFDRKKMEEYFLGEVKKMENRIFE